MCVLYLSYSDGQTFIVVNLKEERVCSLFAHHYSDGDLDVGVVVVVGGAGADGDDDEGTCTAVILQIQ